MTMPLPKEEYYTSADFDALNEHDRWELIDGVAFMMAPPSRPHQGICGELHWQLYSFLRGKSCKVYASPSGVGGSGITCSVNWAVAGVKLAQRNGPVPTTSNTGSV